MRAALFCVGDVVGKDKCRNLEPSMVPVCEGSEGDIFFSEVVLFFSEVDEIISEVVFFISEMSKRPA